MEEKQVTKISLSTFIIIIAIIIIAVMGYFIYKLYNDKEMANNQIASLNNQINKLENINNDLQKSQETNIVSTEAQKTNVSKEEKDEEDAIEYVMIEVQDTEAQGLEYKSKKIEDKEEIEDLMEIIDSAKLYDKENFISDIGDCPPTVTVFLSNGESYYIAAGDDIFDGDEELNFMMKWYTQDGSDKTLYEVDTKLAKYIENLYNK